MADESRIIPPEQYQNLLDIWRSNRKADLLTYGGKTYRAVIDGDPDKPRFVEVGDASGIDFAGYASTTFNF